MGCYFFVRGVARRRCSADSEANIYLAFRTVQLLIFATPPGKAWEEEKIK
jgi:hypothetical protein